MTRRRFTLPRELDPIQQRDMMLLWRVGKYKTALSLLPQSAVRRTHWRPRSVNPDYLPYHYLPVDPVATRKRREQRRVQRLKPRPFRVITEEDI